MPDSQIELTVRVTDLPELQALVEQVQSLQSLGPLAARIKNGSSLSVTYLDPHQTFSAHLADPITRTNPFPLHFCALGDSPIDALIRLSAFLQTETDPEQPEWSPGAD